LVLKGPHFNIEGVRRLPQSTLFNENAMSFIYAQNVRVVNF